MEVSEHAQGQGPAGEQPVRRDKDELARALSAAVPSVAGTKLLIALNVAVFGLMVSRGVHPLEPTVGDLLRFGANYGPAVAAGEPWRVLTCAFLHFGLLHIALNMWGLWQGGQLAERFHGHAAYLALYLASAVGGSLASLAWHPGVVSAGASGAIFGVYGSLLAVARFHRSELPPGMFAELRKSTIGVVGFNVVYGFLTPGIDNAAHLGGLATGFVAGLCLRRPLPRAVAAGAEARPGSAETRTRPARFAAVALLLVAAALVAKLRLGSVPEVWFRRHIELALEFARIGDGQRALAELDEALRIEPGRASAWGLRGDVLWMSDRDAACECYRKAIALDPEYAHPHERLGWAKLNRRDPEDAQWEFKRAIDLDPDEPEAYHGRGAARAQMQLPQYALDDLERALALGDRHDDVRLARAFVLRDLGRGSEALPVFQEVAAKTDDKRAPLCALVAWTIRARAGEREAASAELRERLSGVGITDAASRLIGSYLLGELTHERVVLEVSAAATHDGRGPPIEVCDAWYFVGAKALADGDAEFARWAFAKAVDTKRLETRLHAAAVAELAAMER